MYVGDVCIRCKENIRNSPLFGNIWSVRTRVVYNIQLNIPFPFNGIERYRQNVEKAHDCRCCCCRRRRHRVFDMYVV